MTRGIFDKMAAIVREIAEADGFTMVFERNDAGLVYAPPSLDLTNELIRKYNARPSSRARRRRRRSRAGEGAEKPAAPRRSK